MPPRVVAIKLPPLEVAHAGLVVIALAACCYLLWRVQEVLFLLMLAILLATAIEPLVNRLRRGPFTRGSRALAVYTLIVLVIGTAAYAIMPSLLAQAGQMVALAAVDPSRALAVAGYALAAA